MNKENEEQSLFTLEIMEVRLSPRVQLLAFKSYDGLGNQADHFDSFNALMTLEGTSDLIKCRAFATTLV